MSNIANLERQYNDLQSNLVETGTTYRALLARIRSEKREGLDFSGTEIELTAAEAALEAAEEAAQDAWDDLIEARAEAVVAPYVANIMLPRLRAIDMAQEALVEEGVFTIFGARLYASRAFA